AKHAGEQPAEQAKPLRAAWANAGIDERDLRALPLGRPYEVWPNFALGQHDQRWPNRAQCRLDGPCEVEREVNDGEIGKVLAGFVVPSVCRGGNDALPAGKALAKACDDLAQQMDFADRDAVKPGNGIFVAIDWTESAEPL